jgi:hypothetical protein
MHDRSQALAKVCLYAEMTLRSQSSEGRLFGDARVPDGEIGCNSNRGVIDFSSDLYRRSFALPGPRSIN